MNNICFSSIYKHLLVVFAILLIVHILFYLVYFIGGVENTIFLKLLALFDLNQEQNLPTLYSTINLLISSLLLVLIALNEEKRRKRKMWWGMAVIFLYIGVDEFATIHEGLANHLLPNMTFTGFLKFSWVVIFAPVVLIIVAIYARHIFSLPKRIRNRIILAGAIFVTSGLIIEMIGAKINSIMGTDNIYYVTSFTIEETGELIGILIFIHALVEYLKLQKKSLVVQW
jgi:hypothetical protein